MKEGYSPVELQSEYEGSSGGRGRRVLRGEICRGAITLQDRQKEKKKLPTPRITHPERERAPQNGWVAAVPSNGGGRIK